MSINIFELNFYKDQNKWKHKLFPLEISKNQSDGVVHLLIYKNHYALIEKLNVFLGKQDCRCICKRCLISYASENMIIRHKEVFDLKEITSIRTSPESQMY